MLNIKMIEKPNLKGTTLIEGFPGAGLVGPMAISYIIEKIGMKYVGYIESDLFPPLVAIHSDTPMPPIRIYFGEKANVVTILAEFAIPLEVTYDLTTKLYDFIKTNGIEKIISIGGIPSSQPTEQGVVFGIASTDAAKKELQKAGLKPVGEGVATGVSALILMNAVNDKIFDVSVLVPVDPNILDPKYAELAIISLNKLTNLNIDIKELDKEAKEVEAKITELMKKNRQTQDAHKNIAQDSGPSMYA
jgi:uncharacterized protein